MKYRIILSIALITFFAGCWNKKVSIDEDLNKRYEKGKSLFEKEKFGKAQTEFEYIAMNNPGSQLAVESEFYLAEALFNQEKYPEAAVEFERYIRYSHDLEKIETLCYRVCECAINSSMPYQKDQRGTVTALARLQEFIEDYPQSIYIKDADAHIVSIRATMARKEFETGRLYLKLQEYDAALIYFDELLQRYYDTKYADDARLSIMFTHILRKDRLKAIEYLSEQESLFHSPEKYQECLAILENTANGKLTLNEFIRLYK